MTHEQQTLLHIVRLGIGDCADGYNDFCGLNWSDVINLAFYQGVAAIAVDGLSKVEGYACPEHVEGMDEGLGLLDSTELEDLKYEWFGEVFRCEEDYQNYKQTINGLAKFYESQGIKMMVLKGYGLSLNYPIPSHRPCGDIDVYLYGSGSDADRLLSEKFGIKVSFENPKHSIFSFKGVTVENHYTFTDVLDSKVNAITERVLKKYLGGVVRSDLGCYLPSNNFNYIFLLRHFCNHFGIRSSVNLRQIIDWGLFLKSLPEDFDIESILKDVKDAGLLKLNNLVSSLAEDIIGLNFSKFITERPSTKERERMFEDIFAAKSVQFSDLKAIFFVKKFFRFFTQSWKYKYKPENYTQDVWYKIRTIKIFWK